MDKKQELKKMIETAEESLRKMRIKVLGGTLLFYAFVAFLLLPKEGFIADAFVALIIGGVCLFVNIFFTTIGFMPLQERSEYIEKLKKEYNTTD